MSTLKFLPILEHKTRIVKCIQNHQIVIVTGRTGCGKSTQVPQFIADSFPTSRVICTAPTRVCTVGLAKFVAKTRGCVFGREVGYSIGGKSCTNNFTRIEYQTTGLFKEMLLSWKVNSKSGKKSGSRSPLSPLMEIESGFPATHIVLDEVHDRSIDVDTSLFLVRRELKKNPNLRLILMSASIHPNIFLDYFKEVDEKIPVIHVEHGCYEVDIQYLDTTLDWVGSYPRTIVNGQDPKWKDRILKAFECKKCQVFSEVEICAARIVTKIHHEDPDISHAILVFLPGLSEIFSFERRLYLHVMEKWSPDVARKIWDSLDVNLLHSVLHDIEQQKVIDSCRTGKKRQVILATNIAESSITIPSVFYVIDMCLFKEMHLNVHNDAQELKLAWSSKESILQRAGRAGRVSKGRVFRMIPQKFGENELQRDNTPEIRRVSLVLLILKLMELRKYIRGKRPEDILKNYISPPNLNNISRAYSSLIENGAINSKDFRVTRFGRIVSALPLNMKAGFLVHLGLCFGFVNECILIACIMDIGSILFSSLNSPVLALRFKYKYSRGYKSDVFACYFAYLGLKEMNLHKSAENRYCFENFIHTKKLNELDSRIKIVYSRMKRAGFSSLVRSPPNYNDYRKDDWSMYFLSILIGCAYRANLGMKIGKKGFTIPVGFDPKRTAILNLKIRVKNRNETFGKIRDFVESFDGGFGKVEKIDSKKKKIFVQFESLKTEKKVNNDPYRMKFDHLEATALQLMTKLEQHDFERIVRQEKGDDDDKKKDTVKEIPYTTAYTVQKLQFNSLFFIETMAVGRNSVLQNFSTEYGVDQNDDDYSFCFGYEGVGGDHLFACDCSILPPLKGILDIILLIFCSEIREGEVMNPDTKEPFIEVLQNQSILYFSPLITSKFIKKVNEMRKYVHSDFLKLFYQEEDLMIGRSKRINVNHIKKVQLEAQKRLLNLFQSYHKFVWNKENSSYGSEGYEFEEEEEEDEGEEEDLIFDFIRVQKEKESSLYESLCRNVFKFLPQSKNMFSFLLVLARKRSVKNSRFLQTVSGIKDGQIVTFGHFGNRFLKLELIPAERDRGGAILHQYMQKKPIKDHMESLLKRQFRQIELYFPFVDHTNVKNQIVLRKKGDVAIIPFSFDGDMFRILLRRGKAKVLFENSERGVPLQETCLNWLVDNVYRFALLKTFPSSKDILNHLLEYLGKDCDKKWFIVSEKCESYKIVYFAVPYSTLGKVSHQFEWITPSDLQNDNMMKHFCLANAFIQEISKIGVEFVEFLVRKKSPEKTLGIDEISCLIDKNLLKNDENNRIHFIRFFENDLVQWGWDAGELIPFSSFVEKYARLLKRVLFKSECTTFKLFVVKYEIDEYSLQNVLKGLKKMFVENYENLVSFQLRKLNIFYEIQILISRKKIIDVCVSKIIQFITPIEERNDELMESDEEDENIEIVFHALNMLFLKKTIVGFVEWGDIQLKMESSGNIFIMTRKGNVILRLEEDIRIFIRWIGSIMSYKKCILFKFFITKRNTTQKILDVIMDEVQKIPNLKLAVRKSTIHIYRVFKNYHFEHLFYQNTLVVNDCVVKKEVFEKYLMGIVRVGCDEQIYNFSCKTKNLCDEILVLFERELKKKEVSIKIERKEDIFNILIEKRVIVIEKFEIGGVSDMEIVTNPVDIEIILFTVIENNIMAFTQLLENIQRNEKVLEKVKGKYKELIKFNSENEVILDSFFKSCKYIEVYCEGGTVFWCIPVPTVWNKENKIEWISGYDLKINDTRVKKYVKNISKKDFQPFREFIYSYMQITD